VSLFLAILLGVVQGLTEFIPVSSSAHLVLVPYLLGVEPPGLAFDVALHLGTAAAVIVYFRAELAATIRGLLPGASGPDARLYRRLALLIVLASVPVAIVGFAFEDVFERAFASPIAASVFLFVTAAVLIIGERIRDRRVARAAARAPVAADGERIWTGDWVGGEPDELAPTDLQPVLPVGEDPADPAGATLQGVGVGRALVIGVAQMLALFPGISRSGSTITAGMAVGLTREAATRFSFLLSLPALLGAALVSVPDLREPGQFSGAAIAAGIVAAFVSGYLAIRFLIALVARDRLTGFARYCVAAGLLGLFGYVMIGAPSAS
jgi:undecaprenyl-diphosphatase